MTLLRKFNTLRLQAEFVANRFAKSGGKLTKELKQSLENLKALLKKLDE